LRKRAVHAATLRDSAIDPAARFSVPREIPGGSQGPIAAQRTPSYKVAQSGQEIKGGRSTTASDITSMYSGPSTAHRYYPRSRRMLKEIEEKLKGVALFRHVVVTVVVARLNAREAVAL
jgi:hypothetical protein